MNRNKLNTIADLRSSGYKSRSVKDEMRENLIKKLKNNESFWEGIVGYESTVLPQLQNAILSKHDFILLGLRGQAKTKILRGLTVLLDEYIPIIEGCEINDHPFNPLCRSCREKVEEYGEQTPIQWIERNQRYSEKLATPDVSVADLFGDIDPIKAVNKRLHYAHEGVIHWGIIPRTNRGIFVINELPDLQPRIQVGLLNILEEKDLQIRGFPLRIPLDILIAFSANPEDYTNRGNIITPLKDRIDSQIITHYPLNVEDGVRITEQESWQVRQNFGTADVPGFYREIIENIAREARQNELVDQKSGVSARLAISCLENVISNAELRAIRNNEDTPRLRICDLQAAIPAITGKIELVYEGEQEGETNVAKILIGKAIKAVFEKYFPVPKKNLKESTRNTTDFDRIVQWFANDKMISIDTQGPDSDFIRSLSQVSELDSIAEKHMPGKYTQSDFGKSVIKEFVLEALHQNSFLSKYESNGKFTYKDLVESIFNSLPEDDDRDSDYWA